MADSKFERLLDQYREACRATKHAEDNGRWGDGRPEALRKDELAVRRQIRAHVKREASSDAVH